MKAFDLDAAKRGAAVCTLKGGYAKIITFDSKATLCGASQSIVAEFEDNSGDIGVSSFGMDGAYSLELGHSVDLMMRDDDYLEKLERGEYAPSVRENRTVENPTCKESLPVDREYWRRVYAGQAMQAILASSSSRRVEEIVYGAVVVADALIEELEKTEK